MITCTLRDKKYSVDFISGRALREMEPAAQMYTKIVHLSELAAKDKEVPKDAKFTITDAMDEQHFQRSSSIPIKKQKALHASFLTRRAGVVGFKRSAPDCTSG